MLERMQKLDEVSDEENVGGKKGAFSEKMRKKKKRADKFCSKFCITFFFTFPAIMQLSFICAQEFINVWIAGRSGDYLFIDVVAMTNFLVYFVVYGTAIIFNCVLETLVPHALATDRIELTGHILNRGLFLWTFLFGGVIAAALNIGTIFS